MGGWRGTVPGDQEKRIDLRRLPTWLQYFVSIGVVVFVVLLAWRVGKDDPIPSWVSEWFVPALAWVLLGLVIVAVIGSLAERKRKKEHMSPTRRDGQSKPR